MAGKETAMSAQPWSPEPGVEVDEEPGLDAVLAARDGDVESYARLAWWWAPRLESFCRHHLPFDLDPADAVQDVLLTGWRRLPDLDDPARFRGWIHAIARNRCLELLRFRGRHATDPCDPDLLDRAPGQGRGPERRHLQDAAMVALRGVIDALPEPQRRVWWLCEVEGLGYAEIAEVEQVPVSTVRGRLARARAAVASGMASWR